ncbi:MAG: hypothetical protein GYA23_12945 [Methanomicrobiales archaeon]|nr:hypothetical protein [Methanomicrobiales archaeon]
MLSDRDFCRMLVTVWVITAAALCIPVTASPLNETWSAMYGGPYMENGYAVVQAGDGGYVVAGDARSSDSVVSNDGWMIKTDGSGTKQWDRKFGGSRYDSLTSLVPVPDGYVLAGTTLSFPSYGGQDAWLIRTDSNGNELWNHTYGGYSTDLFNSVIRTPDGGFTAAGITDSYGSGSGDAFLVRIAQDGTEQWHAAFGGVKADRAVSLAQLQDGGYILAGSTWSLGPNDTNLYLIRTDSGGNLIWQKTYGHNIHTYGNDVLALPDGGFVAVGYTDPYPAAGNRSVYAVRTDSAGTIVWEKTPGSVRLTSEGRSVTASSDGGFVITGGSMGLYLLELNSDGTTSWDRVIARSPNDWGTGIEPVSGTSGYIVSGLRNLPANNWDAYLMRVDPASTEPGVVALPQTSAAPTDPDKDGRYEDLNGNGEMDFNDVVLYFTHIDWIADNEPTGAFDFNGNGGIDFQDIVNLFREL